MKKILYFALWLGSALSTAAQTLPNGNLETWSNPYPLGTSAGPDVPTNWQTTDDILSAINKLPKGSYNTGTVTKTTDAHGGSFAAKLSTLSLPTNSGGTVNVPGYLVLGNRVRVDAASNIYSGLPFAARPTQLQFYAKLAGASAVADAPAIQAILSRTVGGVSQIVGGVSATLTATTTTYTLVTLPLTYSSSAVPDSVTIYAVSGSAQSITAGTTLQLDDFSFSGGTLAVRADAGLQALLTVSPNPSPAGRFSVSSPAQPDLAAAPLTVFDVMGREVLRQPAQAVPTPTREIDLSTLALGIYTLRLDSKQGSITRQLVVK